MAVTLDYHNVRGCLTQAQANANARLNYAIGRLGGGVGVADEVQEYQNHQSSVQNDISAKISHYLIAEDDIVASLDLLGISNDKLDEITDLLKELKDVAIKAESGNYSKNELNIQAIDIITELEDIRAKAAYNGIDLFGGSGGTVAFKPKHFGAEKTYWGGMNSTGNIKFEEVVAANNNNKLGEFVEFETTEKGVIIRDEDDIEVAAFNFTEDTTIGDFLRFFNTNGMKGTISDGYISLSSAEGLYAEDLSDHGILAQLGLVAEEKERTVTTGITATSATELSTLTSKLATGSTTLGELITLTGSQVIEVKKCNGSSVNQSFNADNTIDELLIFLNANGLDASIKSGIITLTSEGGEVWAQDQAAGGILDKLGITTQTTVQTKTITAAQTSNASISFTTVTTSTSVLVATTANKLSDFGIKHSQEVAIVNGTTTQRIEFTTDTTLGTIASRLSAAGVTASFADGKMTISATNAFISTASGELTRLLNLSSEYSKTVGTAVTSSEALAGITTSSKLQDIAVSYSGDGISTITKNQFAITIVQNGTERTVSLNGGNTIQQMFNALSSYGISGSLSGGKVTLTGSNSAYIKKSSDGIDAIFRLHNSYYKTSGAAQTSSEKVYFTSVLVTPTTVEASGSTRLDSLGINADQTVTVINGNTQTELLFTPEMTLSSLAHQMADAGLVCYFSDGKLNIGASETSYVKSMSSDLKTALKLTGAFSQVVNSMTTGVNGTSPTYSINGATTLAYEDELSSIGVATNEVITVVQNGTEKSITLNGKTTVREMISLFSSVGISVNVENSKVTLAGSETAYIKRIPSSLQNKLGIFGESYTTAIDTTHTNPLSTRHALIKTRTLNATDTLDKVGINGTQSIIISEKGLSETLFFTNTDTIADVFNRLEEKGIKAEISKGNIRLTSDSASVQTVSSALKHALKLSNSVQKTGSPLSVALPKLGVVDRHLITVKGSTPSEKGDFSYDAALSFISLSNILNDGIEISGAKGIVENLMYEVEKLQKEINTISGKLESKLNRAITERDAVIASYGSVNGTTLSTNEMVTQILNSARNTLLEGNVYDRSEARKLLNAR